MWLIMFLMKEGRQGKRYLTLKTTRDLSDGLALLL